MGFNIQVIDEQLNISLSNTGPQGATGVSKQITASQDIPTNSLCYIKSNGEIALSDALSEGREALVFVKDSYLAGDLATCYPPGNMIDNLSGLFPGYHYFMSTTPGAISANPPSNSGNVVMSIGRALSNTEIIFNPALPITL